MRDSSFNLINKNDSYVAGATTENDMTYTGIDDPYGLNQIVVPQQDQLIESPTYYQASEDL